MSYRPETDAGKVRLLCTDTDPSNEIFSDTEVDAFLAINGNSILNAAAQAIETISRSEALVQKVIKLLDLTTDGSKLAAELRLSAGVLRQQALAELTPDYVEAPVDVFSMREKLVKDWMRGFVA